MVSTRDLLADLLGLLLLGKRTPESVAMKNNYPCYRRWPRRLLLNTHRAGNRAADFGQSVTEEACLAVATPFITARMGDPESVIFEDLKCYRGLEGAVPVARVEATYGYRFAGQVDSKGIIGRYSV